MSATPWSRDQLVTLATLTVGYAGYYLCRSDLSLVAALLPDRQWVAGTASLGVVAYALGKAITGRIGDLLGGRVTFLLGALVSALLTVGCATLGKDHPPVLLWCVNLLAQSAGWAAAVRMLGEWFTPVQYARALSVLSLSYLFGDALVRWALGSLMTPHTGWQTVFHAAGLGLTLVTVLSWWLLADSTLPLAPPREAPREAPPRLLTPSFLCAALAAFGLTLVREALTFWTPALLHELGGMPRDEAARWSGLFPFCGGVSVLCYGLAGARLSRVWQFRVLVALLLATTAGLWLLSAVAQPGTDTLRVALAVIAFTLISPYAILLGMFPLELGAGLRTASLAGLLDAIGYCGAVASGAWIGGIAAGDGWRAALRMLALAALLSTAAVVGYGLSRRRAPW